jgi:hypothetical protein
MCAWGLRVAVYNLREGWFVWVVEDPQTLQCISLQNQLFINLQAIHKLCELAVTLQMPSAKEISLISWMWKSLNNQCNVSEMIRQNVLEMCNISWSCKKKTANFTLYPTENPWWIAANRTGILLCWVGCTTLQFHVICQYPKVVSV